MKKLRNTGIVGILVILALVFTLTACGSQEEGTITINLGGGARSLGWPTDPEFDFDNLTFKIEAKGAGETRTISTKDIGTTTVTVAVGLWNVEVTAYYQSDTFLYAAGSNSVQVQAGQKSTVMVKMEKKYYEIGDTGPGGGIIFYVDLKGFLNTFTNEINHYLEAALEDIPDMAWATTGNPADLTTLGTSRDIGTGRKNTNVILNIDSAAPAASACRNYNIGGKNDWFLPSVFELAELYNARSHFIGSSAFQDGLVDKAYWSSTDFGLPPADPTNSIPTGSANNILFLNGTGGYADFVDGNNGGKTGKTNTLNVRPIRAF